MEEESVWFFNSEEGHCIVYTQHVFATSAIKIDILQIDRIQ